MPFDLRCSFEARVDLSAQESVSTGADLDCANALEYHLMKSEGMEKMLLTPVSIGTLGFKRGPKWTKGVLDGGT